MSTRGYGISFLIIVFAVLTLVGTVNYLIDPYFHYRKSESLSYELVNQRYQNDGITRSFDYNAMIVGTSMCENFKTSEFDKLFGTDSIKICFSGADYKEINEAIVRGIAYNDKLKVVFRGLDLSRLAKDKDSQSYDYYPDYLYNDFLLDDVNYLLNGEVFLKQSVLGVIRRTINGDNTTSFDDYSFWGNQYEYGKEEVMTDVSFNLNTEEEVINYEVLTLVRDNVLQNVVATPEGNPNVDFYFFIPPYSMVYWMEEKCNGNVATDIAAQKILIEECLKHSNVHIYSFCNNIEVTSDLSNYKDAAHYGPWINSQILIQISKKEGEINMDNYEEYLEDLRIQINSFDYSQYRE